MELSSFDTRVLVRGTYPSLVKYLVKATTDLLGNGGIQAAEIENQFNSVDNKAFLEKFISDANVKSIFIQQNPDTGEWVLSNFLVLNWEGESIFVAKWSKAALDNTPIKHQILVYNISSVTDVGIRHIWRNKDDYRTTRCMVLVCFALVSILGLFVGTWSVNSFN